MTKHNDARTSGAKNCNTAVAKMATKKISIPSKKKPGKIKNGR